MKNEHYNNSKIDDMLFLLLENALDKEGVEHIEKWLASGDEAKQYYLDFVNDYVGMKHQVSAAVNMDEEQVSIHDEYDSELWSALAEVERVAESIPEERERTLVKPALIQKVERQKVTTHINRTSLFLIATSVAAMIIIVMFIHFSPAPAIEVATVSESMNADFAGETAYSLGSRLCSSMESLWLRQGIIEVEFDYGARVVIEGPAEFRLNSADEMTLKSGRLYAYVPGRSKGFSVETPMACIIDLGTEFAVKVDFDGASDVHMIKGKASLIPGAKGQATGASQILTINEGRRVTSSGEVKEIAVQDKVFVRQIDSRTGFVWRGHRQIDLADIVGDGDGFGSGKLEYGINPETGAVAYRDRNRRKESSYQGFIAVEDNPYVDGVFCPIRDSESIQISTRGDVFNTCPMTSGSYWGFVMNSGWFGQTGRAEGSFNSNLQLNGQVYGSKEQPAITMHSNLGVTFDLDAIRQSVGTFKIQRFTALCGISELVTEKGEVAISPKASFYVLLDGQKQFEKVDITPSDGAAEIDLKIPEEVRFLTLMITEGSDRTYDGDWTLFANPKLHLIKSEY